MANVTSLVLVSIGNTRTRVAVARGPGGEFAGAGVTIEPSVVVENSTAGALEDAVRDAAAGVEAHRSRVLVASVADAQVARVSSALGPDWNVLRLGNGNGGTVRVPLALNLEGTGGNTVGVDRLLCALAAAARSGGSPCAVVDAGTCVTVDFVDEFGVFQGGAIAPGVGMALRAMHSETSALPALNPPRKGDDLSWMNDEGVQGAVGKNTTQAMTLGALNSVRGLVRWQVEHFAELGGRYPRVIATGGDAPLLFEGDDLVEHVVPDLQLVGMVAAWGILQSGEEAPNANAGGEQPDDADEADEEV
ncbi:MAG: type III pantothenate kinase [Phycisphaerales bacterium]